MPAPALDVVARDFGGSDVGGRDVVVLGELNPDVLLDAPAGVVRFGQVETELTGACLTLGSSGAITAAACRALGLTVTMVAVVGDDAMGSFTVALLAATGVDTAGVIRRADVTTGVTVVINAPDGDRALLTHVGAMAALRAQDVPPDLLAGTRHVHVSSVFLQRGLLPGLAGLFAGLRAQGVSTSLDTGWDPDESWAEVGPALQHTDYLLPNEAELHELAGHLAGPVDRTSEDSVLQAARAVSALGPTVVCKRGGRGALLCSPTAALQLDTTPQPTVDTTGAGDNFDAGFLYGVLTGASPAQSLCLAVAAGNVAVQGRGGTGRMSTIGELTQRSSELLAAVRGR